MSTCEANETALASGLGHVVRRKNTKGKVKEKQIEHAKGENQNNYTPRVGQVWAVPEIVHKLGFRERIWQFPVWKFAVELGLRDLHGER